MGVIGIVFAFPSRLDPGLAHTAISQIFSITLTANHFFLDALAGGVVALAGIAVAIALSRWVYPWAGAQMRRSRVPAIRWLATPQDRREAERTPA